MEEKQKPKFYTVAHLEIPQYIIQNTPLWYLDMNNPDGIKKLFEEIRVMTNYNFGNTHLKWSNIFGDMFSIHVHYQKKAGIYTEGWNFHVWDNNGSTSVMTFNQQVVNKETDILSKENYHLMSEKTQSFSRGMVDCSDCKKEIPRAKIAGRYFAGIYCTECWEGKWKAIEARETYD